MEVSFPAHVIQDQIISVSESDMAALYDALKDCFLTHLEFADYKYSYSSHEKTVVELCKKYNVNYKMTSDRLAFFKALLGVQEAQHESLPQN